MKLNYSNFLYQQSHQFALMGLYVALKRIPTMKLAKAIFSRVHATLQVTMSVCPLFTFLAFLVADKRLYKRFCPSVGPSVGRLVGRSVVIELESVKTPISAPAHPSATGIGRVSVLVGLSVNPLVRLVR